MIERIVNKKTWPYESGKREEEERKKEGGIMKVVSDYVACFFFRIIIHLKLLFSLFSHLALKL